MKFSRLIPGFTLMSLLLSVVFVNTHAIAQHGFSVPQYEQFHDVLHPLEHEALPKKNFKQIRTKAPELVKLGKAIVAVGLPAGTKDEHKDEFAKELKKFDKALAKFSSDAKKKSDVKLKTSYSAVHDSFEMLAGMLPRG